MTITTFSVVPTVNREDSIPSSRIDQSRSKAT